MRIKAIEFEIVKLKLIKFLLKTIPTAVLLYCSYKGYRAISSTVVAHQNIFYKSIKRALLKIEHILNNHNNATIQMSYSAQGQLYYWLCKLRTHADHIPVKKRLDFLEDLEELEAYDLGVDQKLSTINRMYRTYSFLLPTRGKQ